MIRNIFFGAVLVAAAIASADIFANRTAAQAQNAPRGSCLLPDRSWCWPVSPTSYGRRCFCPDGRAGVGQ